ncbi:hypothetical protein PFNF54_04837 [Plasmodium falciparum NF54]|uniref:Uncharacterized protein n=1 Tax=Plasmodium falciparum (isolate NF54) TaxID=5843 RepID=W7JN83_PLAFO|nr:hypothetical protein PFNF54_04837 [Plasmodium falciparum NF54]
MKCHCVEYYSGQNHIKNTTKICSDKRIFSNLLTISGIFLVLVLNCIIICDKSETENVEIYDIYRRNLSEVKCVEHSGLRGNNGKVELKNNIVNIICFILIMIHIYMYMYYNSDYYYFF